MKKNLFKFSFIIILAWFILCGGQVKADTATTTIRLQIKTNDASLYDGNIDVGQCADSQSASTTSVNAKCAVEQSGLLSDWSWWGDDIFLNSIGAYVNNSGGNGVYWAWFGNLVYGEVSLNKHLLRAGEKLLLTYNINPLKITVDNSAPYVNATSTITVQQFGLDASWSPVWSLAASSTLVIAGQEVENDSGVYEYTATTTESILIYGKKASYINSDSLAVTAQAAPIVEAPAPSGGSVIITPAPSGGSENIEVAPLIKVDLGKAIDFLISKQSADGSFSSALQTDWAAIALASANASGAAAQKVKNYLLSDPNPLVGMNPVSDYARRAMALMSLNISPYDGTKTNYVKKIIDLSDGRQFGNATLYNDDIFALIVLNKAGYTVNDEIIQNAVNFIISKQQTDGSWVGSDLTAAAIQALKPLSDMGGVASVLEKARNFLFDAQSADGGYGNAYTTTWVMQAIAALGEDAGSWQKNNNTPESYLTLSQSADGGLEKDSIYENNRIWSTAYAIPAVQGKPWFSIMKSFAKQETAVSPAGLTVEVNLNENKIASSTLENLDIAISSPEVLIMASSTEILLPTKTEVLGEKIAVDSAEWLAEIALEASKIVGMSAEDFVVDGTKNTAKLGAGERAGVLNSYKSAFGKSPKTQADWEDVIRISNNQLPLATNSAAEKKVKIEFKKVYGREADLKNANGQAALNMMTYGLRPERRDLNSERVGIRIFVGIYKYLPVSAFGWDIVRAIAYSGVGI